MTVCWILACAAPPPGEALAGASPGNPPAAIAGTGFTGMFAARGEQVVAAEAAGRLFVPASVTKLVVTAAALHHLGPEHRISTVVRAGGELDGATLAGDLILEAAGDPTWSERRAGDAPAKSSGDETRAPLDALARQLAGRGIRRVAGDLVIDAGRFPGRPFPTSRPASEYAYGYAAPTSALAVGGNAVRVEIASGPRIGAPGTARLLAGGAGGSPRLINRIHTVSKERHGAGTVDVLPVWEGDAIVVRGEYPISEPPYVIDLSVPTPELHAGRHLLAAFEARGVEIEGGVRLERRLTVAPGLELARLESPALAQRLEPILTDSNNWHAEMLLRALAAEVSGAGRLDEGLEIERRFLEQEVGCAGGSFHLDDASGLSPYNLITPRCVARLLRYALAQPWRDAFMAALASRGEGTLEVWRGLPPVIAKTGSIRHTLALAGYLDPESPDPIVFAVFVNHQPGARGPQRAEIAGLLRRWSGG